MWAPCANSAHQGIHPRGPTSFIGADSNGPHVSPAYWGTAPTPGGHLVSLFPLISLVHARLCHCHTGPPSRSHICAAHSARGHCPVGLPSRPRTRAHVDPVPSLHLGAHLSPTSTRPRQQNSWNPRWAPATILSMLSLAEPLSADHKAFGRLLFLPLLCFPCPSSSPPE
jgi:hypothetical protein